jgi:phenylacetate-CoA ligase
MLKVALYYIFTLRKNQWRCRTKIEQDKWDKLIKNINYAYKHVPYYREKLKKTGINPKDIKSKSQIMKIPLTTKQDIIESKLRYISDEFKDNKLFTSRTSGSTGEPFVSYFDKRSWQILKFASKYRARKACSFSLLEKFVIIEAMPIEEAKSYNSSFKLFNLIAKKKMLSVYDSLESHVKFYEKFKPTTLYGFPSYFVNLVGYLQNNSFKLNFVQKIFTSSEVLDESSRKIIEDYFNCKVNDIYGSTETKEVAWECPEHEGYHINEDLIYLECIDDDGQEVKYGKIGKLVITSLENKAMPLLRYYIGDTGIILNKKCSCGRTFLLMKPVYGRITDYFTLKNNKRISPYELTMSVEGISGIMQYQILQKRRDLVQINLRTNENFKPESTKIIISNLKNILGEDVGVNVNFVSHFNMGKNRGKFRVVKSELKNEI